MTTIVIWTKAEYEVLARGRVYHDPGLTLFGNPSQRKFNKETQLWEDKLDAA